ncbi:UNKNOWN [Stylonychia lemnae]|uniref:Uncharacterized protein n=1 Tax=Stylonychia lemnae TaxID=5949 RepID=A0A078B5N7_STYLE|nr:UNKNOWN [Stylonychia lemnae]|eukprot:CDW88833.1 UNKNOWN [Stylonychia lemnae]
MATSFDFVYSQIKNLKKKLNEAGLKDYIKVVDETTYQNKYLHLHCHGPALRPGRIRRVPGHQAQARPRCG